MLRCALLCSSYTDPTCVWQREQAHRRGSERRAARGESLPQRGLKEAGFAKTGARSLQLLCGAPLRYCAVIGVDTCTALCLRVCSLQRAGFVLLARVSFAPTTCLPGSPAEHN